MLVAQIEERRAELAFLRTVWPQEPTRSAGVAPESGARTDDETLGGVGSQGVAQDPMADTDKAGIVECEVQAGVSDAEGCQASDAWLARHTHAGARCLWGGDTALKLATRARRVALVVVRLYANAIYCAGERPLSSERARGATCQREP